MDLLRNTCPEWALLRPPIVEAKRDDMLFFGESAAKRSFNPDGTCTDAEMMRYSCRLSSAMTRVPR